MIANDGRFQIVNGVAYKKEIPANLIAALEDARRNGTRIVITYGDTLSGKPWKGIAISGYVGVSHLRLPILLHRKRAAGGECIKDSAIIEVRERSSNNVLYMRTVAPAIEVVFESPIMDETGLLLPLEEEGILSMEEEDLKIEQENNGYE